MKDILGQDLNVDDYVIVPAPAGRRTIVHGSVHSARPSLSGNFTYIIVDIKDAGWNKLQTMSPAKCLKVNCND